MVTITFGRSPDATVTIDDEYLTGIHCQMTQLDDGRVIVEDLGSTNGTFVNNRQIRDATQIGPGDVIRIGRTVLPWRP